MNVNKHTAIADFHCYQLVLLEKGDFNRGHDRIQTPSFFQLERNTGWHTKQGGHLLDTQATLQKMVTSIEVVRFF